MRMKNILTLTAAGVLAVTLNAPVRAAEPPPQSFTIHQECWSREDYSQQANPNVFTATYDREFYNAIRQALEDQGTKKNTGSGSAYTMVTKEDYGAVARMLGRLNGLYRYEHYVPSNLSNYYEYLDYFAVSVTVPEEYEAVLTYLQPTLDHVAGLETDREKVGYLSDYLCTLLDYDRDAVAALTDVFSEHGVLKGSCGTFAGAFNLLCQAADIPCFTIRTNSHVWNMVYADGSWGHVDVSRNDLSGRRSILLTEDLPDRTDIALEATEFLKELLVSGSTK